MAPKWDIDPFSRLRDLDKRKGVWRGAAAKSPEEDQAGCFASGRGGPHPGPLPQAGEGARTTRRAKHAWRFW